jgi:amino acid transporter
MTDQDLRFLNELMNSWAVQVVIAAFFVGLVIVAFTRASRTFKDDRTRRAFRVAVAALGVLVVLQAVVTAALGSVPFPPVLVIEFVWLFALWLYYFIRFMTRQRSGPGDPATQRRGAALDGTISRMEQERRSGGAGSAGDESVASR